MLFRDAHRWPLRHKPNVLMLHFSDMKRDHEGTIRKVAAHLGITPTAEQWERILEYTSFPWMKANEDKFEIGTILPFKLVESGGMVRKGKAGASREDGMTPEIAADIHSWAARMVTDEAARQWMFAGGDLGETDVKASKQFSNKGSAYGCYWSDSHEPCADSTVSSPSSASPVSVTRFW